MFREEKIWRRKTLHIKKSCKKVRTLKCIEQIGSSTNVGRSEHIVKREK